MTADVDDAAGGKKKGAELIAEALRLRAADRVVDRHVINDEDGKITRRAKSASDLMLRPCFILGKNVLMIVLDRDGDKMIALHDLMVTKRITVRHKHFTRATADVVFPVVLRKFVVSDGINEGDVLRVLLSHDAQILVR